MTDITDLDPRPWYISGRACDDYKATLDTDGGDLTMLKTLKFLRSIIVNIGIVSLALYGISQGGDPTLIATVALGVLGGYNGLEFSDYLALVRAYQEVQAGQQVDQADQTGDSSDDNQ